MKTFRQFELEAIRLLAAGTLPPEHLDLLAQCSERPDYEYTGSGYFLTISAPWLPSRPATLSKPIVLGCCDDIQCGFLIFLGDRRLTLECHTWGPIDCPPDFRVRDVTIRS